MQNTHWLPFLELDDRQRGMRESRYLLFLNHRTKFLSHTTLSSSRPSGTRRSLEEVQARRIPSKPIICVNNCHQLNVAIIKPVIVRIAFHRAVAFQRGPFLNGRETSTDVIDMHVKRLNFWNNRRTRINQRENVPRRFRRPDIIRARGSLLAGPAGINVIFVINFVRNRFGLRVRNVQLQHPSVW